MIHEILTMLWDASVSSAQAAPEMASGDVTLVRPVSGLITNMNIGQVLEIISFLGFALTSWRNASVRHAMHSRDMKDMRRDIGDVQREVLDMRQSQRATDDYIRQLPAIIMGAQRGFRSVVPAMSKSGGKLHIEEPLEQSIREEFGGEGQDEELLNRALEAARKVFRTHE